jgi:hypothetical protein
VIGLTLNNFQEGDRLCQFQDSGVLAVVRQTADSPNVQILGRAVSFWANEPSFKRWDSERLYDGEIDSPPSQISYPIKFLLGMPSLQVFSMP